VISPAEDLATFTTNVLGTLNTTKAFLPYLRTSPGHRTIANFGSVFSWQGIAGGALYCGTKWAVSGISEAMRPELAPFGIAVTVIEPGYFRTRALTPGAQLDSAKRLECYDGTVGETRRVLEMVDGKQPGDVEKAARVIVDVLSMQGKAEGKDVPGRVVLGKDAVGAIEIKCRSTLELLGEWGDIVTETDYE
jgi:NAD(P)-dependent dehydrogenase (short-subunit alcohol dehydrogenase family)